MVKDGGRRVLHSNKFEGFKIVCKKKFVHKEKGDLFQLGAGRERDGINLEGEIQ